MVVRPSREPTSLYLSPGVQQDVQSKCLVMPLQCVDSVHAYTNTLRNTGRNTYNLYDMSDIYESHPWLMSP